MKTLIAVSFPTEYTPLVMITLFVIGCVLLSPVSKFLQEYGLLMCSVHPAPRIAICLYVVSGTLMLLSPAPLMERIAALLLLSFLLQLSVMDVLSGWLPRQFTLACLVSGVLINISLPSVSITLLATVLMLAGMGVLRELMNWHSQCEVLGMGDVWLMGALCAWLTGLPALIGCLMGLSGFVLWHLAQLPHQGTKGGPLGPWLSLGSVVMLLERLYQPIWVI
ncbi:prepilin peptidase [Photorhabdus noenieputensis]|uniref:prepilin peptidase n=1 Tax=Photorhabdus noenieputensis TaxID=1208607 RepID=UPI001BD5A857|nr:A24 family peptidase [Photorhabdus noenieputensis]MBS9439595.1 prepilin peptidase [Photorhabdus noenieputensis]MCK3668877.1 A24 family peptidase [Photorhabdus noenieputensis]